jgi:hypothetical protein
VWKGGAGGRRSRAHAGWHMVPRKRLVGSASEPAGTRMPGSCISARTTLAAPAITLYHAQAGPQEGTGCCQWVASGSPPPPPTPPTPVVIPPHLHGPLDGWQCSHTIAAPVHAVLRVAGKHHVVWCRLAEQAASNRGAGPCKINMESPAGQCSPRLLLRVTCSSHPPAPCSCSSGTCLTLRLLAGGCACSCSCRTCLGSRLSSRAAVSAFAWHTQCARSHPGGRVHPAASQRRRSVLA